MRQTNFTIITLLVLLVSVLAYCSKKTDEINAAKTAYDQGNYNECAKHYANAIKLGIDSEDTYYNYACCLALNGEKGKAFDNLEKALEEGFINIDLLKNDKDLVSLQKDKRWLVVVSKGEKYQSKYFESINVWVYRMYEADQRDRLSFNEGDDWGFVAKKDSMRRERIKSIMANSQLKVSDDYYHAAMIMHHGADSIAYKIANELTMKAVELDSTNDDARWLYAASKDRYLINIGKSQIYGTQYNYRNGKWTLNPIDRNAVTDEDRKFWRVSTLEETKAKIARLNNK